MQVWWSHDEQAMTIVKQSARTIDGGKRSELICRSIAIRIATTQNFAAIWFGIERTVLINGHEEIAVRCDAETSDVGNFRRRSKNPGGEPVRDFDFFQELLDSGSCFFGLVRFVLLSNWQQRLLS